MSPEAAEWDDEANAQEGEFEEEVAEADLSDEEDADAYFRDVSSRPARTDSSLYSGRKRDVWWTHLVT